LEKLTGKRANDAVSKIDHAKQLIRKVEGTISALIREHMGEKSRETPIIGARLFFMLKMAIKNENASLRYAYELMHRYDPDRVGGPKETPKAESTGVRNDGGETPKQLDHALVPKPGLY